MRRLTSAFNCCFVLVLCTAVSALRAQSAATTQTAEVPRSITVFGEASRVYTDYGQDGDGYTFGGDYTFNKRLVSPSVEVRFTHGGDVQVNQTDFEGGIKLEKGYRRFRPYLNALLGYGTINFTNIPGYLHDNSITYDLGLGLDYYVTRSFAVRIDAQQQYWKLGNAQSELEPSNISLGIVYRLPAGFRK